MLVLSRKLGGCFVIGREFVELSITRLDGTLLGTAAICRGEASPVFGGVWARVVKISGDKVRLGIECRAGDSVERMEDCGPK